MAQHYQKQLKGCGEEQEKPKLEKEGYKEEQEEQKFGQQLDQVKDNKTLVLAFNTKDPLTQSSAHHSHIKYLPTRLPW